MYEVELKFRVNDTDPVVRQLAALAAEPHPLQDHCDLYFNHPVRDFEQTNEALRVRSIGNCHLITYKGPVVDSQTKTRREIEIPLEGAEAGGQLGEILRLLSFRPVREVRKKRHPYRCTWQGRAFEVALDDVAGLGHFVEIETQADEAERAAAVAAILAFASHFQLGQPEKRSYLSLLLEKDAKELRIEDGG